MDEESTTVSLAVYAVTGKQTYELMDGDSVRARNLLKQILGNRVR